MKTYKFTLLLIWVVIASCTTKNVSDPAQEIIDRTIEASGGDLYTNSEVRFDFRDMSYIGNRNGGLFTYERIFEDSAAGYRDVLNNEGFVRYINGERVDVIDSMAQKYTSSVNSVLYFALLPYGLNDSAVIKEYLGETSIKEISYDKVKITFQQDGGGEDYQDVFVYWINKENGYIDYMGYTYETEGGGKRFREAYNARIINGIRFQDYVNYKPEDDDSTDIVDFDQLYQSEGLEELSKIELKNIEVLVDKGS